MSKYTPEWVDHLKPNEYLVFGSNVEGLHAGGAANFAYERFGAVWGQGEGLQGQSYAIPTMGTLHETYEAVQRFLGFARLAPGLRFLVTPIGTGIAEIPAQTIAPFFAGYPVNVIIPREFAAIIEGVSK